MMQRENQAYIDAQERERTRELPEVVEELRRRVFELEAERDELRRALGRASDPTSEELPAAVAAEFARLGGA